MSDTAESFRDNALECERKAALTTNERQRLSVLNLARRWREMAADYEGLSRKAGEDKAN